MSEIIFGILNNISYLCITMEIITRKEAQLLDQTWFFTGKICKNNHIEKRYTKTGVCYGCKRQQNSRDYITNHDKALVRSKRAYKKLTKEQINTQAKKWATNNKEKRKEISKRNKLKYQEEYRKSNREYQRRKRECPYYRLSRAMSKGIWLTLHGKKDNKNWFNIVGYNLEDLKQHLEKQFKPEMTWENYGSYWHVDHIKPLSWFNLETEFDKAWSINNLQPLEVFKNLSKNNRYEGEYRE
jgi:hypothetical protein